MDCGVVLRRWLEHASRAGLVTRDFGLLFVGQVISQIGDSLNKVALLWFVYDLTGWTLRLVAIGLLQTIPPLLIGPVIGVYLDRLPKKSVMIWVDLIRAVLIVMIPVLHAVNALTLERLYLLVFLTSIVSTVFGPALASSIPLIVERERLTAANAMIQSTWQIGLLLGPTLSGVGIALMGAQNVLYVDAATFLISACCLMPIHIGRKEARSAAVNWHDPFMSELLSGFRYIFVQQQLLARLMVIATLFSLGVSSFVFLLPVFAKESLRAGPIVLGVLWSALGGGMLLASLGLAAIQQGELRDRLKVIAGATALGGLTLCGLSLLKTPGSAGLAIVVFGGSTALFHPIVWAALQELTPAHMLGRVFTTFSTGAMSSAMAGMAGIGWVVDVMGPTAGLIGIGLILLGTSAVTRLLTRGCL